MVLGHGCAGCITCFGIWAARFHFSVLSGLTSSTMSCSSLWCGGETDMHSIIAFHSLLVGPVGRSNNQHLCYYSAMLR